MQTQADFVVFPMKAGRCERGGAVAKHTHFPMKAGRWESQGGGRRW